MDDAVKIGSQPAGALESASDRVIADMLRLFMGELSNDTFEKVLGIICRQFGASRVYLVRFSMASKQGKVECEYCSDTATPVKACGYEFKLSSELGWSDSDDVIVIDVPDVNALPQNGNNVLNLEANKRFGVKSLYVFKFSVGGSNWGSVGITYEQTAHRLTDVERVFAVDCTRVLQLAVERRDREEVLRRERDRAQAADKAKSYFFSTVSHDIRTPLNAIVGFAEMLKLGIESEVERKNALNSIIISSRTLLQLINDVLDLSKLEAGRMEILPEPTDVISLVSGVAAAFRASTRGKSLAINTDVPTMPFLKIDPQRIRQILFNLVGNAVKFTNEGSITISAKFLPNAKSSENGTTRTGSFQFSVADTGCGISREDMERIAQPYIQVGGRGNRNGGTGLGLTICRQLVSRMNGEIELESKVGRGSTFYVSIPEVPVAEEEVRRRLTATQQIKLSISDVKTKIRRVLIVDDSPVNLSVLKAMLRRFDITDVTTASNGKEALNFMRTGEGVPTLNKTGGTLTLASDAKGFDLVLTDMWMPEMDGEEFVAELRKNPRWRMLPVYAVTADVESRKNYREAGFTGVLLKPITFEVLGEVLNNKQ